MFADRQNHTIPRLQSKQNLQAEYKIETEKACMLSPVRTRHLKLFSPTDSSGWWKGRLHGQEGLFPGNYVEKI